MMRITALLIISLVLLPCLGFATGPINSWPNTEELLDSVRLVVDDQEKSVDWLQVASAITRLGELRVPQAQSLLIGILRRETPIRVVEGASLPGIMPPLEMLKAAAIDALVKLGDKESLPEIERIAHTTGFEVLREKAKGALLAIQQQ